MMEDRSALRLRLADSNEPLLRETERLVDEAQPLLWRTLSTFPSGTSHTPEHTLAVEQIASMLIPDAILSKLNDFEVQLLILGCHYHDLGMAGTEEENSSLAGQEQARRDHAVRIGELLKEKWQEFGFPDYPLAEALAEVCRGHRPTRQEGIARWDSIRETAILGPNKNARLRVVSSLLYAADELHIGADRASMKEERWIQLTNDESRRHWKRHQIVHGPISSDAGIEFQVCPTTIASERDIREKVLAKAMSAVVSANALLEMQGFDVELGTVSFRWNRSKLWSLLMVQELSDMVPRTEQGIRDAILAAFSKEADNLPDLASYGCFNSPEGEALTEEIDRVVSDFVCRDCLHVHGEGDEGEFVLNTGLKVANGFFELSKRADELDVLLEGRYAAKYDFVLQRSEYGSRHTRLELEPAIYASYGVPTQPKPESPIAVLLRSSPTARRLSIEGAPYPSVLSKPHALALAVLTGASLDLLRDPALILEGEFRTAYKNLSALTASEQLGFTRLMEELALVDGYTLQQLTEALQPSVESLELRKDMITAEGVAVSESSQVTISQGIPRDLRPITVSFPHLYLASVRAKTTVAIQSSEEAPLQVSELSQNGDDSPEPLASLSFGPGPRLMSPTIPQRADFAFDRESNEIAITIRIAGRTLDRDAPLLVQFNSKVLFGAKQTTVGFSFYMTALTAQHLSSLSQLQSLDDSVEVSTRLVLETDQEVSDWPGKLDHEQRKTWDCGIEDAEFLEFLCEQGSATPFPWWCPGDVRQAIDTRDRNEWSRVFQLYTDKPLLEKEEVATFTLRIAHEDGRDYSEEFLCIVPRFAIGPPRVEEESNISQQEVDELWQYSEVDCMLGGSFSADEHEIAQEVRDWAANPSLPFPIQLSGDPPRTPVFRSRCEIIRRPLIDRHWFAERQYMVRLRPINEEERWNVEGSYWQAVGDEKRDLLVRERLTELKAIEEAKQDATGLPSDSRHSEDPGSA